jgi:D-3-phosphoglycerate dehydrogenase
MSMEEGIALRIELLNAHRKHIESLIRVLKRTLSPSVKRNKPFFKTYRDRVFVVSNGFHEFIEPVVETLGIRRDHVHANTFEFDEQGYVVGFDSRNALVHQSGKARVLKELGLRGEVFVIGDGYSDFETRKAGVADLFYAFTENTRREPVVDKADHVLPSLDEFLYLHDFPMSISYPKTRIRALLLEGIDDAAREHLEKEGYSVESVPGSLDEDQLIDRLEGITLLGIRSRTRITRAVVESSRTLKAIGAFCIGTNQFDLDACSEAGVIVFNAPYANTRSVVELALGQILMLARRVFDKAQKVERGQWDKSADGCFEVRGKSLGIVGYGNIGSQLSVLAESIGMDVCYYDIVEKLPLGNATKCGSMKELLKRCDVVSAHVDGNPHNHHLFSDAEFRSMKDGALFLNLSRGFVVDHEALARAILKGKLGGAAVDVFPSEPKSKDEPFHSPLRGLPNVILTPHIGGSTHEAQRNVASFVSDALINFINTGSSFSSVNFPSVQLPALRRAHRFVHIHANEPGVLAAINHVMAEHSINILGQHLKTNERIGYVITDVSKKYAREVIEELKSVPHTIHFRVLY